MNNNASRNLPLPLPGSELLLQRAVLFLVGLSIKALDTAARWQQRSRNRRRLLEMDDHQLRDIGLDRVEVERLTGRTLQ